jgi:phosphoglycolate phosphatase
MKQAVIFDFDGTIADSLPAFVQVFEELTKRSERLTPDQIQELRDLSVPEFMSVLRVPKWKAPMLLFKGRRMLRAHMTGITLHEGMATVIKNLHADGIPLYVLSSNSTENVTRYLQHHKLSQYFNGVYGGASVFGKAPLILRLLRREKIAKTKSWYVGDEMRDVSAARAVGLHIASVTWGFNTHMALATKKPDVLVDTAPELQEAIEAIWKK